MPSSLKLTKARAEGYEQASGVVAWAGGSRPTCASGTAALLAGHATRLRFQLSLLHTACGFVINLLPGKQVYALVHAHGSPSLRRRPRLAAHCGCPSSITQTCPRLQRCPGCWQTCMPAPAQVRSTRATGVGPCYARHGMPRPLRGGGAGARRARGSFRPQVHLAGNSADSP